MPLEIEVVMLKLFSTVVGLALSTCLLVSSVLAAPNDLDNVQKTAATFSTDWNHHDIDAFGKLFATDADFMNATGQRWEGRKEIQTNLGWVLGAIPVSTQTGMDRAGYGMLGTSEMRFTRINVRLLRKDVAIVYVEWQLFDSTKAAGNTRHGWFLFVLARQGDGWSIATAQNQEGNSEALRRRLALNTSQGK